MRVFAAGGVVRTGKNTGGKTAGATLPPIEDKADNRLPI
jgi:hypothetical protein